MSDAQADQPQDEKPGSPPPLNPRRHDLDALRAFAMLLGIALHAALSFMPGWPVQDRYHNEAFEIFVSAVHGFRMPLFFLISGFFTAMLWRRRGLRALVAHRFKRILIPCLLCLVTIVPLCNWSFSRPFSRAPGNASAESQPTIMDIWTAAAAGDSQALQGYLDAGADIDAQQPGNDFGPTPLSLATLYDRQETVSLLLDAGADANATGKNGGTALHSAAFFGRVEIVRILLEHGAEKETRNADGQRAKDLLMTDWGITKFIADMVQVELDREELTRHRKEIAELLGGDVSSEAAAGALIIKLFFSPVFHHLWFLWMLCWLLVGFAATALVTQKLGWVHAPAWLTVSPWRLLWLFPLTMVPQAMMGWTIPTFGPDTSAGLLPWPPILLYYAVFFAFGALYFDAGDAEGRAGRWWPYLLPVALFIVFPMGLGFTYELGEEKDRMTRKLIADSLQVAYVWMMCFAFMGMFRRIASVENRKTRYVSDSSYWLYIAHLPLIVLAQDFVSGWDLPAALKFTMICMATTAVLLLTYHYLVRYTWLGTLLNGRRQKE